MVLRTTTNLLDGSGRLLLLKKFVHVIFVVTDNCGNFLTAKMKNWKNEGGGGSGQVGTEKFVFQRNFRGLNLIG